MNLPSAIFSFLVHLQNSNSRENTIADFLQAPSVVILFISMI